MPLHVMRLLLGDPLGHTRAQAVNITKPPPTQADTVERSHGHGHGRTRFTPAKECPADRVARQATPHDRPQSAKSNYAAPARVVVWWVFVRHAPFWWCVRVNEVGGVSGRVVGVLLG